MTTINPPKAKSWGFLNAHSTHTKGERKPHLIAQDRESGFALGFVPKGHKPPVHLVDRIKSTTPKAKHSSRASSRTNSREKKVGSREKRSREKEDGRPRPLKLGQSASAPMLPTMAPPNNRHIAKAAPPSMDLLRAIKKREGEAPAGLSLGRKVESLPARKLCIHAVLQDCIDRLAICTYADSNSTENEVAAAAMKERLQLVEHFQGLKRKQAVTDKAPLLERRQAQRLYELEVERLKQAFRDNDRQINQTVWQDGNVSRDFLALQQEKKKVLFALQRFELELTHMQEIPTLAQAVEAEKKFEQGKMRMVSETARLETQIATCKRDIAREKEMSVKESMQLKEDIRLVKQELQVFKAQHQVDKSYKVTMYKSNLRTKQRVLAQEKQQLEQEQERVDAKRNGEELVSGGVLAYQRAKLAEAEAKHAEWEARSARDVEGATASLAEATEARDATHALLRELERTLEREGALKVEREQREEGRIALIKRKAKEALRIQSWWRMITLRRPYLANKSKKKKKGKKTKGKKKK